ncbi:MAG: hypothetical protein WBP12_01455 [Candidatus Saccharimonas sp.]
MPLVDITMRPGYQIQLANMRDTAFVSSKVTRALIKHHFSRALPDLIVARAKDLDLDPTTPSKAVQIMNHDYGRHDVNIVDIWIKILFTEDPPKQQRRQQISSTLHEVIIGWFSLQELIPGDLFLDVFWCPASGMGSIDGEAIHY